MKFPETLTVTARDHHTGLPVENVAIVLVLFATRKNNYYIGPLISGHNGQVDFTRSECEFAIKHAQEMFIMDYQGDLESCRPIIEVSLHPQERIDGMRLQYESAPEFWGRAFKDPSRLFNDLKKVKNADYEPARISATEEQFLANPELELLIVKKNVKP